jgi:hypothetical protein
MEQTCILCVNEELHLETPDTLKCRILFETEPAGQGIFSDGFICKLNVAECDEIHWCVLDMKGRE